jgi:hypothetical protein
MTLKEKLITNAYIQGEEAGRIYQQEVLKQLVSADIDSQIIEVLLCDKVKLAIELAREEYNSGKLKYTVDEILQKLNLNQ